MLNIECQLFLHQSTRLTPIQKTNEELSRSLEREIMLQGEIHHRVKNNLQVIISLLDLQRDDLSDPRALESLNSMSNRIYSMAAIPNIPLPAPMATGTVPEVMARLSPNSLLAIGTSSGLRWRILRRRRSKTFATVLNLRLLQLIFL